MKTEPEKLVKNATDTELKQLFIGEQKYLRRRFMEGSSLADLAIEYGEPISRLKVFEDRALEKLQDIIAARSRVTSIAPKKSVRKPRKGVIAR